MKNEVERSNYVQVAIVGGGVAGSTVAIHLAELGVSLALLEKSESLVNGPPICHLHAGGNLYREISSKQCLELLEQSINTVRLFPHTINRRPTVIATPLSDDGNPNDIIERLKLVKSCYQTLVAKDSRNQVLGNPEQYFKSYSQAELQTLALSKQPKHPLTLDDWMIPFAQNAELDRLKYPVISVQEYGWSVFRLAASASLILEQMDKCDVKTNTTLIRTQFIDGMWLLTYQDSNGQERQMYAEHLVNACGYQTGTVDDQASYKRNRMVEFKAAYMTHWEACNQQWPEVIFHGPRGTAKGMAQLTPYANGVFQLHGMTENITLFKDGLVSSTSESAQPNLPERLKGKLAKGWSNEATMERTSRAIGHMEQFIPTFGSATKLSKPLYGAQQIPGSDATLRSTDVTFEEQNYARVEVVKGSSALDAAKKLVAHWSLCLAKESSIENTHPTALALSYQDVETKALELAIERSYPKELALLAGAVDTVTSELVTKEPSPLAPCVL
ncbi:FAD-dependent oxidoreductase [Vibrio sp. YMD68]|uniref:FAD-dependent oxidoreductase n=1 Tax=Vibrio sp. YMD68 TaxID=3042300 RepID=UPI00249CC400|nr:FAD-dependent oxidoreductase [Vibrio sp. YMD68]WGV98214.1 FAD-dependent oxidoreductase [Vibrio sp. YMD68]